VSADRRIEEVALRVADGDPVDWEGEESSPASDRDRSVVQGLRLLAGISEAYGAGHGAPGGRWGDLEILDAIGSGSFGVIYLARDPRLDRIVALKVLRRPGRPGGGGPSEVVHEARLLAKVRHPNVVTVHGAEERGGEVGIWMEHLEGRSLRSILRDQGPLGAREAALVGVDLARALAAVHGAGLVHGDVKPENVLRAEGGRIVLMDFGSGRDLEEGDPGAPTREISGSPLYMAPETILAGEVSPRGDLYSLGVLLYEMVSGSLPVRAAGLDELRERHRAGRAVLLRDARPDLPEPFVRAVEKSLEPDPSRRYATAGEMERALASAIGIDAGESRPAEVPARRPRATAVLAALALAAAAAGALAVWLWGGGTAERPSAAYEIDVALFRSGRDGGRERLLPGDRLRIGDALSMEVRASRDLHLYVVNEDETGRAFALFPLPGLDRANPLPANAAHRLPGSRRGAELSWGVDTAGGREHLLIVASPEPLVEFERELAAIPAPAGAAPASLPLGEGAAMRLRGLGVLREDPAPGDSAGGARRLFEMADSLRAGPERTSGVWVRHFAIENPRD
jgi:hypothetical protein